MTGGKGLDIFNTTGSETITNLGGKEVLDVISGSVTATVASAWTAGAGTVNNGSATLNLSTSVAVSLANVTSGNGFTINDNGLGGVKLIGGNDAGDTIHGATGDTILVGGGAAVVYGATNDKITAGTGVDTFYIVGTTETITNLGSTDVLNVASGDSVTATIATAGWTAGTSSVNDGTATLTVAKTITGVAVDLAALTGTGTTFVTDSGNGNTLTAGAGTETFTAGANDTVIGGTGSDTFIGIAGDTFTGGSSLNTFNVTKGTDIITNLGHGTGDSLAVSKGAIANATVAADWTATSAAQNGTVNLTDAGHSVNLAAATGTGVWNVTDTSATGTAVLTASAGSVDNFTVASGSSDTLVFAAGDSSATGKAFDTITGLGASDQIDYTTSTLTAGVSNETSGKAYVTFDANGNATFFGTAPTTEAKAVTEILTAFNADGGAHAGEYAAFNVGGNEYLFIVSTANETAPSVTDTVIQLIGVTSVTEVAGHIVA